MKQKDVFFEMLYKQAWAAGVAAAVEAKPAAMIVGTPETPWGDAIDYTKQFHVVQGGVCGFAWVKIRPANSAFAKWLKKTGKVKNVAYTGGYDIWISEYGQSMARKSAHAEAMAAVLKEAGINAYADERMD